MSEVVSGRRLPRALTPFRHPAYRRLAVALILSTFATGVWAVAMVWEVIRIDGGPAQLSVVSTAGAVGVLLPALLGGVVADRIAQKLILLVVAAVELASMALVAALSITDHTELWHLAVIGFVSGMGWAFYYPAYSAWLPALVPESDLMAVNGFEGMIRPTIGQAVGPAVAGVVVGAVSPGAAVAVAAGSSLLGLLALATVPLTAGAPRPSGRAERGRRRAQAPRQSRTGGHARGLRLHGPHPLAAGHAAVRLVDDPGDDGPSRRADPVPHQGPARRRSG